VKGNNTGTGSWRIASSSMSLVNDIDYFRRRYVRFRTEMAFSIALTSESSLQFLPSRSDMIASWVSCGVGLFPYFSFCARCVISYTSTSCTTTNGLLRNYRCSAQRLTLSLLFAIHRFLVAFCCRVLLWLIVSCLVACFGSDFVLVFMWVYD